MFANLIFNIDYKNVGVGLILNTDMSPTMRRLP